jgi:cytochrome P450
LLSATADPNPQSLTTRWTSNSISSLWGKLAATARSAFKTVALKVLPFLWPNARVDPTHVEPLPPGSMGCPVVGRTFFWGSSKWGVGSFYPFTSRRLRWPRIFKHYFLGCPFVAVSGLKNLQSVLNREFEPSGIASAMHLNELMGQCSIAAETSKDRHQFLRRLVGQALTPSAVTSALPVLEGMAIDQIIKREQSAVENGSSIVLMDRVVTDYTLDVARKQILGLDIAEEELPTFVTAVHDWIAGVVSARAYTGYKVKESKGYAALKYLEGIIGDKIDDLERNGPDGSSTLSGMVFARDEDDTSAANTEEKRKLSRQEVIDNVLFLILAGSETSSSTLANAVLMLGLNRKAWNTLVDEQRHVRRRFGDAMTKESLDRENAPFLDAVIREALRIRPISGGIPRVARGTMVVDGQWQIPKGWFVDWNGVLTHYLDPKTFRDDGSHMDVRQGFLPDRWMEEASVPSEFVPFGVGPRYCLGSYLALAEMKVFLSLFARHLDYELANDKGRIRWKHLGIIARVKDELPVRILSG